MVTCRHTFTANFQLCNVLFRSPYHKKCNVISQRNSQSTPSVRYKCQIQNKSEEKASLSACAVCARTPVRFSEVTCQNPSATSSMVISSEGAESISRMLLNFIYLYEKILNFLMRFPANRVYYYTFYSSFKCK